MTSIELSRGHSPTAHTVAIGDVRFLFSYATCVAVQVDTKWHVSENVWGRTTGGHIMSETGVKPDDRMPRDRFLRFLARIQVSVTGPDVITLRRVNRGSLSVGIILDGVPEDQPSSETARIAAGLAGEDLHRYHATDAQRFSLEPGTVLVTLYKN